MCNKNDYYKAKTVCGYKLIQTKIVCKSKNKKAVSFRNKKVFIIILKTNVTYKNSIETISIGFFPKNLTITTIYPTRKNDNYRK